MEEVKIKAYKREERGTAKSRLLRRGKVVPAVVYGQGINMAIKIDEQELKYLRQHHFSENIIINLEIADDSGNESVPVLLKDFQRNPLNEEVIHLDFIKVSMKEKVTVEIPVEVKGEAKGVKAGGTLEHALWKIEVECLPGDIPESLAIDVTELDIGHSIHVGDIQAPQGVEILTSTTEVVVTIAALVAEEEAAVEEETVAEPEVVREKAAQEAKKEAGEEKSKEK